MPRGFLGATGELDEIELVIVLAEPGDPKGTEKYLDELAPSDTVRRVVDFVHETYVNQEDRRVHGKVQRVIRWFFDRWFRGINFEVRLEPVHPAGEPRSTRHRAFTSSRHRVNPLVRSTPQSIRAPGARGPGAWL